MAPARATLLRFRIGVLRRLPVIAFIGVMMIGAAAAILGTAAVGHAGGCSCPPGFPVDCTGGDCQFGICCPAGNTCHPGGDTCCPPGYVVPCNNGECCPANTVCNIGTQIEACCDVGSTPCSTGHCCPGGSTCNPLAPGKCCRPEHPVACPESTGGQCCPAGGHCMPNGGCGCPSETPVQCSATCCPSGTTCNTLNGSLCCPASTPVSCANACCPAGSQCTADGHCLTQNSCSAPYPVDCGFGFCCPAGDRCSPVLIRSDVYQTSIVTPYCCIDTPPPCSVCPRVPDLADGLGSAVVNAAKGGASKCRKSSKGRPFEVLQVAAGGGAPASFDPENTDYSIAFVLGRGKKKEGVVLSVPIIRDDSSASSLSVMIPPYVLSKKTNGSAELFLVANGIKSDTCLGRVRIAKLPKSASKVPGLVTASWLRANQMLYSDAKPVLTSAAAAPFVNPEIIADVDNAVSGVGGLIPSYTGLTKKSQLAATAKHSDGLLTGMLSAGGKVPDLAFASASSGWVQALSKAKDANDPSLMAAESAFVNVVSNPSGGNPKSVGTFITACGAVTSAGMASSAGMVARGAHITPAVDAQATSVTICGATITACGVITGVRAAAAGATITPGVTIYGRTLLRGSTQNATSIRTSTGVNLGAAKICGCRQPGLQGIIDIVIIVIKACDHIRVAAPIFCLPDGTQHGGSQTTTTTVTTTTQSGPTTTQPCATGCPGERVIHKCPWTPEGFSIDPCCPGYCWDGGGRGSLSCDQEKPGAPGEEVYGNATVPHSHRSYTTDLICDDGYVPERERCTGLLLRCVPAQ